MDAKPPIERFIGKFTVSGDTGCWEWQACFGTTGYGQFRPNSTSNTLAHRFSYTYFVGLIPKGLQINHLCENKACVNPDHLEAVTPRENMHYSYQPSWEERRNRNKCTHGHEYTKKNTRINKRDGSRACRECDKLRARRYRTGNKGITNV